MKKLKLRSFVMMGVTLVVLTIILQGGCGSNGNGNSLSHDDSAKIAASYNLNKNLCPKLTALEKRKDSTRKFISKSHPFYYYDASFLPWAKRSIIAFRGENNCLVLHDGKPLASYFVSIDDIEQLKTECVNKGKILSGIRLYFGKDVDHGAIAGEYTHFIFPTQLSLTIDEDLLDCGFIEQIKPEVGLVNTSNCTGTPGDIICRIP